MAQPLAQPFVQIDPQRGMFGGARPNVAPVNVPAMASERPPAAAPTPAAAGRGMFGSAAPRKVLGIDADLLGDIGLQILAHSGNGGDWAGAAAGVGQSLAANRQRQQIDALGITDPAEAAFARANPGAYLAQRYAANREDALHTRDRGEQVADRREDRSWQVDDRDVGLGFQRERAGVEDGQFDRRLAQDESQFTRKLGEDRRQADITARVNAAKIAAEAGQHGFSDENQLRTQFLGQAKTFTDVRDAYSRIQAVGQATNPAQQMSLIFGYMKMLDPGSTVREGEYATAQNTTNLPGTILNYYNRAREGNFLNETQVQEMLTQARAQYENAERNYGQVRRYYDGIARSYGMDPERVLPDFRLGAMPPLDASNPADNGRFEGIARDANARDPRFGGVPSGQPPLRLPGAYGNQVQPGAGVRRDPAAAPQAAPTNIPPPAIQDLRSDPSPEAMQEFDQVFGQGAAQRVLNGAR